MKFQPLFLFFLTTMAQQQVAFPSILNAPLMKAFNVIAFSFTSFFNLLMNTLLLSKGYSYRSHFLAFSLVISYYGNAIVSEQKDGQLSFIDNQMNQDKQIELVFEGFGLAGNIYIGTYAAARDLPTLRNLGIRAVITAARGLLLPYSKEEMPNYLYLPVDDNEEQQLSKFFRPTADFIEKNRNRTHILVHCYSGISRSAALVMAYLIWRYGYTVQQSLAMLKRGRRKVRPNRSFLRQLENYQAQLQKQQGEKKGRLQIGNQRECGKKSQLISELRDIRKLSINIQSKLGEAMERLQDSQRRRRSSSQYLKQRLQQKSAASSRAGSVNGETPAKGMKMQLELLKQCPRKVRNSIY